MYRCNVLHVRTTLYVMRAVFLALVPIARRMSTQVSILDILFNLPFVEDLALCTCPSDVAKASRLGCFDGMDFSL